MSDTHQSTPPLGETDELAMQIDLLVDEELAEPQRHQLLQKIDRQPSLWRSLSIRFLERQTERRAARRLISQTRSAPQVAVNPSHAPYPFPTAAQSRAAWVMGPRAIAAGLLVAALSAVITWYAVAPRATPSFAGTGLITAQLPGSVVGMEKDVKVDVPVAHVEEKTLSSSMFLQNEESETPTPSRSSLVIQPDGKGGAVVVPVNTLTNVSWQ